MKTIILFLSFCFAAFFSFAQITGSRMNEVFKVTTLSNANVLNNPWEVTYGPDGYLWVTESVGYKVYRVNPNNGNKTTVLDLTINSTDLAAFGADSLRVDISDAAFLSNSYYRWPQGGLAGLAIHPDFMTPGKEYVYISYIHKRLALNSNTCNANAGNFYRNKLVRFTYNAATGKLGNPIVLCDTLPGSSDHNSQRIIIAPVVKGGTYYVFYANGDMGAGQYENRYRVNKAQNPASYEGKILRFNAIPDNDADKYDKWIPNDNPYNGAKQSAVYSIGIRNNQGFAYDTSLNILYGASHGPYSDDEINIIQSHKNYGHPLVVGFAADGNYNGTTTPGARGSITAGFPYDGSNCNLYGSNSSLPPIGNEQANVTAINANGNGQYQDPVFSAYPTPKGIWSNGGTVGIANIWGNNVGSGGTNWTSEAWSGLDFYSGTLIPGWNRSLIASSLKWGRLVRLKMGATGTSTLPSNIGGNAGNVGDTVIYFDQGNKLRDLAFSSDGKDIFIVMDKRAAGSGPSAENPKILSCPGCLVKYTFLGYADNAGKSSIPTSIDVTNPPVNQCVQATTIVINEDNKNYWVPVTGPDGNILAEINSMGQVLDTIKTSVYKNSGTIRIKNGIHYLDRNITITPKMQPVNPVKIRLYISKAEFDALDNDPVSSIASINTLKVLKTNDPCSNSLSVPFTIFDGTATTVEAHGANGYVAQVNSLPGFSTFYFAASGSNAEALPLTLVSFTGTLQPDNKVLLKWKTAGEQDISHFVVERSIEATNFTAIGTINAQQTTAANYVFTDERLVNLLSYSQVYYRLKMVDENGTFRYSKIIMLSLSEAGGKVTIIPNPANTEAKISINAKQDGQVRLYLTDNTGRIVLQQNGQVRKGPGNNIILKLHTLASGVYYLKISGGGIEQLQKLQKL